MRIRPPTPSGLVIGAVAILVVTAGTATAAKLITGADIKDGSVASADLKNNNIASGDIKDGTVSSADLKNNNIASGDIKDGTVSSADVKDGTIGTQDLTAAAINSLTYSGPNWSIVDRNVIGNGDSYLRAGPNPPIRRTGSEVSASAPARPPTRLRSGTRSTSSTRRARPHERGLLRVHDDRKQLGCAQQHARDQDRDRSQPGRSAIQLHHDGV